MAWDTTKTDGDTVEPVDWNDLVDFLKGGSSSTQAITAASDTILANARSITLNPDGNYKMNGTPTIADATTAGEWIFITCANAEANTITLQDQDTLANSNLQLLAPLRTITGKEIILLRFDGTDWVEMGSRELGTLLLSEASPTLTLKNLTAEDTDGGRESTITVKGIQSGDEETTLGWIRISHDGAADDEKGKLEIYTNDGSDADAPTLRITVDAAGNTQLGDGGTTNYTQIAADGEITQAGTARVKKRIYVPTSALAAGGTPPDATNLTNHPGYSYDLADDSIVEVSIPPDWDTSTDLTVGIRWYINEAYATASGEVQWQVAWSAIPVDASEAVDGATHTGTIDSGDINIPATAKFLTENDLGTIASASLSAGDSVGMTFERVALDGGTDPTADPVVVKLYVEYTSNKRGEAT